jgi:hypothetical protein
MSKEANSLSDEVLCARAAIEDEARADAVAKQRGRWTVCDAVSALLDLDSFVEGDRGYRALPGTTT